MKKIKIVTWIFIFLISIEAKWKNIGPGGGGWIQSMVTSPFDLNTVYAGCDVGGFYKSTDGGRTWKISNAGLKCDFIQEILPHPKYKNIIFLATPGGVYKSINGGESWELKRVGFPKIERYSWSAPICSMAIDPKNPNIIYAGIGKLRGHENTGRKGTIYKSIDFGESWFVVNTGENKIDPKAMVISIAIHPRDSQTIFIGTDKGVYKSEDGGVNWIPKNNGLPHTNVRHVVICPYLPNRLYLTLWSQAGKQPLQSGVYRSDDSGENWRPMNNGLKSEVGKPGQSPYMTSNLLKIVLHPENPDIAFVGDVAWVSAGVYKTVDGGLNWELVSRKETIEGKLANIKDYGWLDFWGLSPESLTISQLPPFPIYFGTSGHIFKSTDLGETWTQCYTKKISPDKWFGNGLETTCLFDIVVHPRDPNQIYFCYFDIGLIRSDDNCKSFYYSAKGPYFKWGGNFFTITFDIDYPLVIFAGVGQWATNEGYLAVSIDGGKCWKLIDSQKSGLPVGRIFSIVIEPRISPVFDPRIPTTGYKLLYVTVDGHGLYRGRYIGGMVAVGNLDKICFEKIETGLDEDRSLRVRKVVIHPKDPNLLFLASSVDSEKNRYGGLFVSKNRGKNWQPVTDSIPLPNVLDVAVDPINPKIIYVASRQWRDHTKQIDFPGGVFKTEDGGRNWQQVLDYHFVNCVTIDPRRPHVIYVGTNDHPYHDECVAEGILRSDDRGKSWKPINDGLSCLNISCITVDPHRPDRVFVGTHGNGVFVNK